MTCGATVVLIVVPVIVITVFLLVSFCIPTGPVSQNKKNKLDTDGTDLPPKYSDLEPPGVALDCTTSQPPSYEDISNEKRFTHPAKKNNNYWILNNRPSNDGLQIVSETLIESKN